MISSYDLDQYGWGWLKRREKCRPSLCQRVTTVGGLQCRLDWQNTVATRHSPQPLNCQLKKMFDRGNLCNWCIQSRNRSSTTAPSSTLPLSRRLLNPLTHTVAVWVQLWRSILVQTGLTVICNFWHPGTLTLVAERQSARMLKITNDGLTRSGTGCFIAVPIRQQ